MNPFWWIRIFIFKWVEIQPPTLVNWIRFLPWKKMGDWTNQFDLENQPVKVWSHPIDKVNHFKEPGKPRKVPFFLSNWMAGFRGFKLMEINVATAGNPRKWFKVRLVRILIRIFSPEFWGEDHRKPSELRLSTNQNFHWFNSSSRSNRVTIYCYIVILRFRGCLKRGSRY